MKIIKLAVIGASLVLTANVAQAVEVDDLDVTITIVETSDPAAVISEIELPEVSIDGVQTDAVSTAEDESRNEHENENETESSDDVATAATTEASESAEMETHDVAGSVESVDTPDSVEHVEVETPDSVEHVEVEAPEAVEPVEIETPETPETPEAAEPVEMETPDTAEHVEMETPEVVVDPAI